MRLAVLSYGLPTPGQKRGGVDRVAHDLAQGLARRGHAVTVFSHDDAPPGALYARRPLPGAWLWRSGLGKRLTMGWLGHGLLLGTRFGNDVDVILSHGDSLLLPLLRGRPVLRVMHGSALAEARSARSPWRWLSQTGVYVTEWLTAATQPGRVVAVSENTRRDFRPFIRPDRVVPNGVDLAAFPPAAPGEKSAEPSVVFVGVHGGRKRGGLLREWFAGHIRPRFPTATLHFVGPPSGPAAEPGVRYHTDIPTAELAALLRQAWAFASPSVYEGFGLPYAEAMASGTPVLATPNPGSQEVLANGAAGVLADDAAFPGELLRLLGDAALRARLTAAGLARARELSLERTVDRYERILTALRAERPLRGMTNDE